MAHEPKKIIEMWAWIVTEDDGGEGIPAFATHMGWMPMVGADEERIRSLEAIARDAANEKGLPLKLVKFHAMETVWSSVQ